MWWQRICIRQGSKKRQSLSALPWKLVGTSKGVLLFFSADPNLPADETSLELAEHSLPLHWCFYQLACGTGLFWLYAKLQGFRGLRHFFLFSYDSTKQASSTLNVLCLRLQRSENSRSFLRENSHATRTVGRAEWLDQDSPS